MNLDFGLGTGSTLRVSSRLAGRQRRYAQPSWPAPDPHRDYSSLTAYSSARPRA